MRCAVHVALTAEQAVVLEETLAAMKEAAPGQSISRSDVMRTALIAFSRQALPAAPVQPVAKPAPTSVRSRSRIAAGA